MIQNKEILNNLDELFASAYENGLLTEVVVTAMESILEQEDRFKYNRGAMDEKIEEVLTDAAYEWDIFNCGHCGGC